MEALDALTRLASTGTPPDPDTADRISVGLERFHERLETECFLFLRAGGSELRFVEAPYGRGKTHLLRTIEARAERRGFVTCYVECHSGRRPFASFRDSYGDIAGLMRLPGRKPGGVHALIADSVKKHRGVVAVADLVDSSEMDRVWGNVAICLARSLAGEYGSELAQIMSDTLRGITVVGCPFSGLYRRYAGLPRPLGRIGPRNGGAWVRSICAAPRMLGFSGLVIMFDEVEAQLHSAPRSRREHLANLRNLVDYMAAGAIAGAAIFYAVPYDFLEKAREELAALAQRIERPYVAEVAHVPNARAIWCLLDDMTEPAAESEEFIGMLVERLVNLVPAPALNGLDRATLVDRVKEAVPRSAAGLSGSTRYLVKAVATEILSVIGGPSEA